MKNNIIRLVFSTNNVERLSLFLAGVLISGVASGLIGRVIEWSEALLIVSVIVVSLIAVFLITTASHRIHNLADQMEATVRYVEEPYRTDQGIPYKGHIFDEIARLVTNAEEQILLLGTPYSNEVHDTALDPSRKRYLDAIEDRIEQHLNAAFKYIRIMQAPWETSPANYRPHGELTINHCITALEVKQKLTNPNVEIHIMTIKSQRLSSFMIVDKRWLVLEIDGYDPKGTAYMVGAFFLEDRRGKLIERFIRYFQAIEREAKNLSLEDLQRLGSHVLTVDAQPDN